MWMRVVLSMMMMVVANGRRCMIDQVHGRYTVVVVMVLVGCGRSCSRRYNTLRMMMMVRLMVIGVVGASCSGQIGGHLISGAHLVNCCSRRGSMMMVMVVTVCSSSSRRSHRRRRRMMMMVRCI